jgi:predicted MFS family arabinose efflux permease
LNFWGVYFPFYYVSSSLISYFIDKDLIHIQIGTYGRTFYDLTYKDSVSLLLLMNGVGVVGRLVPNIVADRALGPLNTIIISSLTTGIITFCWVAVRTRTGLWAFAAFFGLFAAGIQSLFPACLASLTPDLQKRGSRMGMGFAVAGVASLTGTPLGGALVQDDKGRFLYAQMWAGASLVAAAIMLAASRYVRTGLKIKAVL